jgi:ATP-binding cassette subfamily F protein 3
VALKPATNSTVPNKDTSAPQRQPAAKPAGRLNPIRLRQMKDRRRAIEDEVTRLEVEIADYEAALAHFKSAEETMRLSELLTARRADLESLMAEWEQVAELIEANQ